MFNMYTTLLYPLCCFTYISPCFAAQGWRSEASAAGRASTSPGAAPAATAPPVSPSETQSAARATVAQIMALLRRSQPSYLPLAARLEKQLLEMESDTSAREAYLMDLLIERGGGVQ